jgi:hypothetical protein
LGANSPISEDQQSRKPLKYSGNRATGPEVEPITSICSGWLASIMGPLKVLIQPRTRTRLPP